MRTADLATLFGHLYWMRDRVLASADDPAAYPTATAPGGRDLRTILVHELDVEWSWRERLRAADRTRFAPDDEELRPEDLPDVAALRVRWDQDEAEMRAWIAGMSDATLDEPCRTEAEGSHPFWYHVQHIYSHGVIQLADAATVLTAVGRSPGDLDFLDFVRSRDQAPPA